jgi:uncharacterized protein YndB with AHSA1/START domain
MSNEPLTHDVIVEAEREKAFEAFASHLGSWWPLAYTFSGPQFEDAKVERRAGGSWYERNAAGETLPWGEVRAYTPGDRLVLSFAIGADRKPVRNDTASEVEIMFSDAVGGRTRIDLTHRDFERHGKDAEALRTGMNSPPRLAADSRGIPAMGASARGRDLPNGRCRTDVTCFVSRWSARPSSSAPASFRARTPDRA